MPDPAAILSALADGIIPPDETDAGAATVKAGPRLAERVASGVNAALYQRGLALADQLASQRFRRAVDALTPDELHALLEFVRDQMPPFFKQLRMDVATLYLSDPRVCDRIGFPGPSADSGGYPDFDQPQMTVAKSKSPPPRRD